MRLRLLLIAVMLMPAPVAAAQPQGVFYECDVSPGRQYPHWISSKIGVVFTKKGKIVISDGITLRFAKGLTYATLDRETDKEFRISWRIEGRLTKNEQLLPTVQYRATLAKATNKIDVRGQFVGTTGRFSGRGQCVLRTK